MSMVLTKAFALSARLAIEAIKSPRDMETKATGRVIKCIHSLTDGIWAFSKEFQ